MQHHKFLAGHMVPNVEPGASPTGSLALKHPCDVQGAPTDLFGIVMSHKLDHPHGGEPIHMHWPPITGQLGNGCQSTTGFCGEDFADVFLACIGDTAVPPEYSHRTSMLLMNLWCNKNIWSHPASPPSSAVQQGNGQCFEQIPQYSLSVSILESILSILTTVSIPSPCDASAPELAPHLASVPPSWYHLQMVLQVLVIVLWVALLHIHGD